MKNSPVIYEINAHVWALEQPWFNKSRDLAEIPDNVIQEWACKGINYVWFLGVWTKGEATRQICLRNQDLRISFEQLLPDLLNDQVGGSPFSIRDYSLSPMLGNEETLPRLREKLHCHGMRLMLDFVPNHMAVDHPWVSEHPAWLVQGTESLIEQEPHNYFRVPGHAHRILAHGRDPYFWGWSDTVQVNIFNPDTRRALTDILLKIGKVCDGVRCDMSMLLVNNVFRRTWGDLSLMYYPDGDPPEFWVEAIQGVKNAFPEFTFMAEVYWDMECDLQAMGFDYTYDKALYDKMLTGDGIEVIKHLQCPLEFQARSVRFTENHDEARAAQAFGIRHAAAAVLVAALPGAKLYDEGQFEGRMVRLPVQLLKKPYEEPNEGFQRFYENLFDTVNSPVFQEGDFQVLEPRSAWDGNESYRTIATFWRHFETESILVVANLGDHQSQAYTNVVLSGLNEVGVEFQDLLSEAVYHRWRGELEWKGLYLDIGAGAFHVFKVRAIAEGEMRYF